MAALGWGLELSVGDSVLAGGQQVTDHGTLPPRCCPAGTPSVMLR